MVALEDDEAVCIPEKIRLSMLNLTMSPSDPVYKSWRKESVRKKFYHHRIRIVRYKWTFCVYPMSYVVI